MMIYVPKQEEDLIKSLNKNGGREADLVATALRIFSLLVHPAADQAAGEADAMEAPESAMEGGNEQEQWQAEGVVSRGKRRRRGRRGGATERISSAEWYALVSANLGLLLGLIQIYQNQKDSLFESRPATMAISLAALCISVFAPAALLKSKAVKVEEEEEEEEEQQTTGHFLYCHQIRDMNVLISGEQRGVAKEAEAIFLLPEFLLSPSSDCPQIERTLTIVLLMIELFLLLRFGAGLEYEYKAVNLLKAEQFSPEFTKLNPIGYVPVLVDEDTIVSDSFAILLVSGLGIYPLHLMSVYLEEKYPQHPLLPHDLQRRAINYQKYIAEKVNPDEQCVWARNHIGKGLEALEKLLHDYAGKYATGDEVYLADCFIAPQLYGAIKRFSLDMTPYPLLSRLNEAYNQLPAFVDSAPENQPDTPV
ncbi:hypothetical protein RHSIM_Rhsim11G0112700 [Rhododendron simsii]|uniref:Uncharacterized protein n=1 Tax=Rhododendron simsii TaxID=118357 RepID=A0A834G6K9_RHOSS|nr:hypothetical protein RHSIM_Rhsim11G0112700 [Rhododendron simsii]